MRPADSRGCEQFDMGGGNSLEVRPTTDGDAVRLQTLFTDLPLGDSHRRFFSPWHPQLDWCRQWASVGERGGFGVIALAHRNGRESVVGEAGYAVRSDGDGELAVTVADGWRGWLGAYLLDRIVDHAAQAGIRNLQADVLLENTPMLRLLRHRGAVTLEHPAGTERLTISTEGYVPTWPPNSPAPRVLVEVAGGRWNAEGPARDAGLSTAFCTGPTRRTRHACPVLDGGRCPLVDEADAIVVLLDPDETSTIELIRSHREQNPSTPIIVRGGDANLDGCQLLTGNPEEDVETLLATVARDDVESS